MADTPTRKQLIRNDLQRTLGGMQGAYNGSRFSRGGPGLETAMAFMGAPNLAPERGWGAGGMGGSGSGQWTNWPHGGGNGNNPDTPGNPDDLMLKAGLPQWWINWLHSSGQYGGVPPTGGLLD